MNAAQLANLYARYSWWPSLAPTRALTTYPDVGVAPIGYWPGNEASGNLIDAIGSNDFTDNNTVGSATGDVGLARDFESGSTEYFSAADSAFFSRGNTDFTWGVKVRPESLAGDMVIIGKVKSDATNVEYILRYKHSSTAFQWWVSDTGSNQVLATATTFGAPVAGRDYSLLAWHDSVNNVIGIEVNSILGVNTTSHSAGVFDGSGGIAIGREGERSTDYWDGLINHLTLWDAILDSDQRAAWHAFTHPRDEADILAKEVWSHA